MVGEMVRYAFNRAVEGAVDSAARRASWMGAAIFLFIVGGVFGLIVLFWLLDMRYDAITAGSLIAAGCGLGALICLLMPRFLDWLQARSRRNALPDDPMSETAAAVQEEVEEAVDYFGPIRVVGSALLLGMGMARSFKQVLGPRHPN